MSTKKELRRNRIKLGIRHKISGTTDKPRLAVFRSNNQIYAQIIDDVTGVTLASASSLKLPAKSGVEQAKEVGEIIAKQAISKGLAIVKFDRSGYLYHGRVKALAEAAREGGLKF